MLEPERHKDTTNKHTLNTITVTMPRRELKEKKSVSKVFLKRKKVNVKAAPKGYKLSKIQDGVLYKRNKL